MAIMQDCLDVLRRRIGDTETPYTFTDSLLTGYIIDAVNNVEMDYNRGITIESGEFAEEISQTDVILFTIKAHFLVKLRTKDKSDRDNFLMRKGRLTLDNTNQSGDHMDTLELLDKEYKKALTQVKNNGQLKGIRME